MRSSTPASSRVVLRSTAVGVGWIIVLIACVRLASIVKNSRFELYDFVQEWTPAKNFLTGEPVYQSMDQSLPRYFPRIKVQSIKYNAHPPFSVLLSVPFGALKYHQAYMLWNVGSMVLAFVSVRMIAGSRGLTFDSLATCGLALLLVTSNSFEQQIFHGQWNCVLLCLLSGAWLADRSGRTAWSGVLIGIAGAVKLVPLFLLLYFVARRQWRALVAAILTFVILNGLTAAILGIEAYSTYFSVVTAEVAKFRDTWPNASLLGFWSKLFDGGFGHVQTIANFPDLARVLTVASAGLFVVDVLVRVGRSRNAAERDLAFALAVIAMVLVSPIAWDHYFVMLTLPLAIFWRNTNSPTIRGGLLVTVFFLITLSPRRFWSWTVAGYSQQGEVAALASPWMTVSLIAYQTYLLIGLYLLARSAWKQRWASELVDQPSRD